jgi:molybdate transport system permease protein
MQAARHKRTGAAGASRAGGKIRLEAVFGFLTAVLLVFVLLPIALLLPEIASEELRTQLAEGRLIRAIGVSLASASAATLLAAGFGIPAGYLLAHRNSRASWVFRAVILLPTVLPPVAAGVLLLNVYGPAGPIGVLVSASGWSLVNAFGGVVLAQLFVTIPFVVLTAEASFRTVDPRLEEASETLGQSRGRTFFRIALPLAGYGILAGIALAWMRALGEFGATVVMAYHPHSLPVFLWVALTGEGIRSALPVALVTLLIAILALLLAQSLARAGLARRRRQEAVELRGPAREVAATDSVPGGYPTGRATAPAPGESPIEVDGESAAKSSHPARLLEMHAKYGIEGFELDISLEAGPEVVSLFGPSGAGKSTLLRLVAGLARPDAGKIVLGGTTCLERSAGETVRDVPASGRPIGMVFQQPALFPHLDVARNVLYGVPVNDPGRAELLAELLATTRLDGLERRLPGELSGGQQQRVAVARALARRPRVLLLDAGLQHARTPASRRAPHPAGLRPLRSLRDPRSDGRLLPGRPTGRDL